MTSIDLKSIIDVVNSGGVAALLIAVIIGGARRWWVFGWQYDAVSTERDHWREMAMHGNELASKATDAVGSLARK
jgi:hypothetical protein